MAKFPTYEEMAKDVAERALDKFLFDGKSIREWMQIIASEDAISRQAVLGLAYDMSEIDGEHFTEPCMVVDVEDIQKLPSVNPKDPKTGHWIMSDDGLYRPICNNCGAHPWKGYIPTVEEATEVFKYCPSCGAKMVEPQAESEEI